MKLSHKEKLEQLIAARKARETASLSSILPQKEKEIEKEIEKKEEEESISIYQLATWIKEREKENEEALARFSTDGNFEAIVHQIPRSDKQEQTQMEPISLENLSLSQKQDAEIVLNEEQLRAVSLALTGESFCLIGPAGTGKTFVMRYISDALRAAGKIAPISRSTKYLSAGAPGFLVVSYTNKAVANIAQRMPRDIHCRTVHKTIEFEPEFYDVMTADGDMVKTMRFEPKRNMYNKLPYLSCIAIEESATVSTHLHAQFMEACSGRPQVIYMGDIQQLPPVFGDAILGYKMLELPVVELTKVMRQAEGSPGLMFAWEILEGKAMSVKYIANKYNTPGKFHITTWARRLKSFDAMVGICRTLDKFLASGQYDPMEDMILLPAAKRNVKNSENNYFCADEINRSIANTLGKQRNAIVHEIIAGYNKLYFAVGDKILYNKQEAIITEIVLNGQYVGQKPLDSSPQLNRFGHYETEEGQELELKEAEFSEEDVELMLMQTAALDDVEERKNQASHIIRCKLLGTEKDEEAETYEISTTGEYADTSFAYALTVHKSQGSEWKRVIILLHNSHDKMISREMLYTAVTRHKESLYIICEANHFEKGVLTQRIKGDTLQEKAEWFKGRKEEKRKNGKFFNNDEGEE